MWCWDAVCFGPVHWREGGICRRDREKLCWYLKFTTQPKTSDCCSLFNFQITLFTLSLLHWPQMSVREWSYMWFWHLEGAEGEALWIWQSRGATPQHEPFLTFYILWTVKAKTGSISVSYERYQRLGMGGGGLRGDACVRARVSLSVWERGRDARGYWVLEPL